MGISGTEPIRVAHVLGKAVQGGVDTLILNYYRHMDRTKVQFDFFMDGLDATIYDDEIHAMGGRVYKLPPYEKDIRTNLRRFREILRANQYKIIHSHMNSLSVFWLREAKRAGVPIRIAHSHSTASANEGLRAVLKYLLKPFSRVYATHFAACSEYAGKWLFGRKPQESGQVLAVHNAIDPDKFKFNSGIREKVRKQLNLSDKFVIGHVGRFVHQKNHKFLLELFKTIHDNDKNAFLLLIGEGELKKEAEDRAAEYGLGESILFLGNRCDVNELFQAMDVFVLPSHYEGLPVVAVEAQASGLPCVMSDRITREAILSRDASLCPLESPFQTWISQINAHKQNSRTQGLDRPLSDSFDIRRASLKLCDFYCSFA